MAREEVVSNVNEQLILVDDQDRELGFKSKGDCHAGTGVLHRAFSIFVLNSENELVAAEAQRHEVALAELLVEHLLLASAPRRVDG